MIKINVQTKPGEMFNGFIVCLFLLCESLVRKDLGESMGGSSSHSLLLVEEQKTFWHSIQAGSSSAQLGSRAQEPD